MSTMNQGTTGLTDEAISRSRSEHGRNILTTDTGPSWWATLKEVVTEPMFILLIMACTIYFVLGRFEEAITLIIALLLVSGISLYQSVRSDQALGALRELTQPKATVRRNNTLISIPAEDIVVGDAVLVEEGNRIPADGILQDTNDFSVDESILTGESVSLAKTRNDIIFAGSSVTSGSAWLTITAVGSKTELGKIGRSIQAIATEKTPLQVQINQFVIRMAWIGVGAFALVWGVNYARSGDWITALLFGLTLAMSILPEEIPVAFSSFMALGAVRLSRMGVLTKQPHTVESLGSATVICTDKTGTITLDGMQVRQLYDGATDALVALTDQTTPDMVSDTGKAVLAYARWASETDPFDPMEKAIIKTFTSLHPSANISDYPMIYEYPLAGTPPMMTHVRQGPTGTVVAGKGAVEHILAVCRPDPAVADRIRSITRQLSKEGYRLLGVAKGNAPTPDFPVDQDDLEWSFLGLVALENPPKPNAGSVIQAFTEAGIRVKMITGDFPETALAIARQVNLPGSDACLTGDEVMAMNNQTLRQKVSETAIFARMFPDAKLRVVEALKQNGEIVAMTGDGVNDGPALKAAHIGVAMGKRGTEVARQAASLVLVNDDLGSMVDAVAQGRRIYQNLQKAIAYIVSIHIPIILTVAIPLLANWKWENLFSPIHVIFLELVMGPTCSIAFENEPAEAGQMHQPPRPLTDTFLAGPELGRSLAQGIGITLAVLGVYYISMQRGAPVDVVRTLTFTTLVLSNIGLTLVNRSFTQSVFQTIQAPNRILWFMLGLTFSLLLSTLSIPPIRELFAFTAISVTAFGWCTLAALVGVSWIEGYKLTRASHL